MKQPGVVPDQPLVPDHEAPEGAEPLDRAFDDPAVAKSAQMTSVLVRRLRVVAPAGDDRLDALALEPRPRRVAVIATVRNQPLRVPPGPPAGRDRDGAKCGFEKPDLRRGCRVQVNSERSTTAIGHDHPLGPLAPLG